MHIGTMYEYVYGKPPNSNNQISPSFFQDSKIYQNAIRHKCCLQIEKRMKTMSLERVLRILGSLGFTSTEAKVYIYLAKMDPQKAKDITAGLRITKQQLYPILNNLQKKGVVDNDSKRPALFSALPIEKLLDLQVKKNVNQAQIIKETKEELLESWQNITSTNNT
jgi:hypothetical protein